MLKTAAAIAGILLTAGCARTVHRLPRAPILPARSTLTACEQKNWIVLAPTRASVVHEKTGRTRLQDGAGVYAIGSDTPLDITDLPKHNEPSPIIERKQEEVASHDTRGHVAMGLGGVGLIAMGMGAYYFLDAFETAPGGEQVTTEAQRNFGALLGAGGFLVGISGVIVQPSHTDRTEANRSRFAFLTSDDDPDKVVALVKKHNSSVRDACEARGQTTSKGHSKQDGEFPSADSADLPSQNTKSAPSREPSTTNEDEDEAAPEADSWERDY